MKRRGVIAVLFAGVMAKASGQFTSDGSTFEIRFPKGPRSPLFPCKKWGAGNGVLVQCVEPAPDIPEPQYVLNVTYGDRTVRLTAAEIMDALEGK